VSIAKLFFLGPAGKAIRNEELSCTEKRCNLKDISNGWNDIFLNKSWICEHHFWPEVEHIKVLRATGGY